jgi:hypothetical protein
MRKRENAQCVTVDTVDDPKRKALQWEAAAVCIEWLTDLWCLTQHSQYATYLVQQF